MDTSQSLSERNLTLNMQFKPFSDPVVEAYEKDVDLGALRCNLRLTVAQRAENFLRNMSMVYEVQRAGEAMRAKAQVDHAQP